MRVQHDCGRYRCDLSGVKRVLQGMCVQYKQIWGPEAFEKQQAQIMSNGVIDVINNTLRNSAMPHWSTTEHMMWELIHVTEVSTGFRKDEFTKAADDDDCLRRSNFEMLNKDGASIMMIVENIEGFQNGMMLSVTSAPSKCDRLNMHWSKQKLYFIMDDTDPLNLPAAWKKYELAHPCKLHDRKHWPAFSPTGDNNALTPWRTDNMFQQLCEFACPSQQGLTVHSYRATLASKMCQARAAGHTHLDDTLPIVTAKFGLPQAGLLPIATDIHVRYGRPIDVGVPDAEPCEERVQEIYGRYIEELLRLFDANAHTCLPPAVAKRGLKIVRQ